MNRFLHLLFLLLSIVSNAQVRSLPASVSSKNTAVFNFTEPIPPASDIILDFNIHDQVTRYQERALFPGGNPVTPSANINDPIGTLFDQSLATTYLVASNTTTLPLYTADGMTFDGVNDQMEVPTTTAYLNKLHSVNYVHSGRITIKKIVDGVAKAIINDCGNSSTTQIGFYLQATAANKIRILISDGTPPAVVDYTSTTTVNIASGRTPVQWIINGASSKLIIGGVTETFTSSTTEGIVSNSTQNLRVGGDGSNYINASLSGNIRLVGGRVWTAQEISDYAAANPSNNTADITPIKQWDLDFNDVTNVFSDLAETTTITNGGFIRSIRSKVNIPFNTSFRRRATSSSDPASPLWRQAQKNGRSTAEFDGTGNQFLTYSQDLWIETSGSSTFFIVIKNDDTVYGSHYINGNPEYGTLTSTTYGGAYPGPPPHSYTEMHHGGSGGGGTKPDIIMSDSYDYNIICIRIKAGTANVFSQTGNYNTQTSFGKFTSSLIGKAAPAGTPDWHLDGMVASVEKYMFYMDETTIRYKIAYMRFLLNISTSLN